VLRQSHSGDLSFRRFGHILDLVFFRDTVLQSRYGERFEGNVENIDRAFAAYFGNTSDESVKKLRVQMKRLIMSKT
jgi:hypothetical protein